MSQEAGSVTRRRFMSATGVSLAGVAAIDGAQAEAPPAKAVGRPSPILSTPAPLPGDQRIGFAVVGLGKLALGEIVDAFAVSRRARLAALVSGNAAKAQSVAARYGVPADAIYDYASFDRIAQDPRVQVVYIVLPNGLHREFAVRAFKAGKHVLCEKPMATSLGGMRGDDRRG